MDIQLTRKGRLIESFTEAIEQGAKYVFLEIQLPYGLYPATELIVNPIENAQPKMEYINEVYDDELIGVHAPIQIISFGFVENLSQLEYARNNSGVN